MNIIKQTKLYFLISLLVMVPGIISLFLYGLNLSIDFMGGSRFTLSFAKEANQKQLDEIRKVFQENKIEVSTIQKSKESVLVRTKPVDAKLHAKVLDGLQKKVGDFKEENFETIGPVVGGETTTKAVLAIIVSSLLIIIYIAWSFRHVPKPASSIRFGICAIIALIHDVLVVVGIFSLLGHFLHVEIDSLFVTALLTVIGFSVHDTIVVFDRVRENLRRMPGASFSHVVNESILQTLGRSLNTSLTVVLVLIALLLFGGESIKWFVVALLVGIASGTYSSIFNAAPLLVVWHNWAGKRIKK